MAAQTKKDDKSKDENVVGFEQVETPKESTWGWLKRKTGDVLTIAFGSMLGYAIYKLIFGDSNGDSGDINDTGDSL